MLGFWVSWESTFVRTFLTVLLICGFSHADATVNNYRRIRQAYRERIRLLDDGDEPIVGIHAVATPGHSPGHISYRVRASNSSLFISGDAFMSRVRCKRNVWINCWQFLVDKYNPTSALERFQWSVSRACSSNSVWIVRILVGDERTSSVLSWRFPRSWAYCEAWFWVRLGFHLIVLIWYCLDFSGEGQELNLDFLTKMQTTLSVRPVSQIRWNTWNSSDSLVRCTISERECTILTAP